MHRRLQGAKKFAVILAFDVPVTREARDLAESMGVRIFTADIIYHLFDQFTAYLKQVRAASAVRRGGSVRDAVTCRSATAAQLHSCRACRAHRRRRGPTLQEKALRLTPANVHVDGPVVPWHAQVKEEEQEAAKYDAVFPCVLKILPTCIFNKKDPIVLGVEIADGIAKVKCYVTQCN
jgi:translation initiation factor IF-2